LFFFCNFDPMEISEIILHIEALIFASDKPLTSLELVELVNNAMGFIEDRASLEQVETAVDAIREKYDSIFYPFQLRQSGGGWQFLTKKEFHKTIAQLSGDKFLKRLSGAAMETLAIVAYKQPITKSEIESIRGVNCDYTIQKLLEKDLVVISGRNEHMPGKPLVYSTSKSFMDYFGINDPADLPKIKEVLAEQVLEPTLVQAEHFTVEEETNLAVSENGDLILHSVNMEEEGVMEETIVDLQDQSLEEESPTQESEPEQTEEKSEPDSSPDEEEKPEE
jgi:segregation and condensation protein B